MRGIFHFRTSSSTLGPLEERLLKALWHLRRAVTVRELVEHSCSDLAYTTVMTTLDRLFKKNLLNREADGRAFRYSARFSREELHQQALTESLHQALDASSTPSLPLSQLVETLSERDAELLDHLKELVETKRRQLGGKRSYSGDSGLDGPSKNGGKGRA
jgi:predicted transcriptional regulator